MRNLPLFSRPPFLLFLSAFLLSAFCLFTSCDCLDCNQNNIFKIETPGVEDRNIHGDRLLFPAQGGDKKAIVKTNLCWEVIFQPDWIESVTPNSGCGTTTITVTAKPNPNSEPRSNKIVLRAHNGALAEVLVLQEADTDVPVWSYVAAGLVNTFALKTDGTLWAWGDNGWGVLGDGTMDGRLTPVQIEIDNIAAIAAGMYHTLALKTDGTLWAWGENGDGIVGDGTTTPRYTPVPIMTDVKAIAASYRHSLALKTDGTLWAWGYNDGGDLGDGTTTARHTPVPIMTDVKVISAGVDYSLAIKTDGTLWAWGMNGCGQFGNGTTIWGPNPATPVQANIDNVAAISAGFWHSLAVKTDGTLWAWGCGCWGQRGDGIYSTWLFYHDPYMEECIDNVAKSPVCIMTGGVKVVAANRGNLYSSAYSLALKTDGSVWAWGANEYGQLGDATTEERHTPVRVMTDGVAMLAMGFGHSLALKTDGTLWAWGNNECGQLGDGTTTNRYSPVQIPY